MRLSASFPALRGPAEGKPGLTPGMPVEDQRRSGEFGPPARSGTAVARRNGASARRNGDAARAGQGGEPG
ncbi:MAG: hypothetical protein ACKOFW_13960, partial [Planctomycetaceae bacterium]